MAHTSVASLVVVLIVAFLTPILLHRFKLSIRLLLLKSLWG
ncbi:Na+/H+ antiporter [Bacillus subtilis]|nr:Na+/H+ antiporter [Bacillus subtilis]